ncbi:ubiquitin-2 like Rad60 SUMO-like-domain-containing protein [Fusarium tricinctum]|uniref:Ubiquitin-2 like Rad60 SUMO-like-domain-containing protein n=1 Tax=Fusarium tricinctum TaxID=61284 RepID=A0A8K0WFM6_9HYPO|nr:ubiquitin-2 like Rad60 SUMO-like-domain-containing protein [Fusarium tricinctum]
MKKLPFKPTALRRPAPATQPEESKDSDDDGLALFRRAKEMAPIMAADRERRLRKRRAAELEAEQRQLEASQVKRSQDSSEGMKDAEPIKQDSDVDVSGDRSSPVLPSQEASVVDQPLTHDEADHASELVTPPPSKRSRISSSSSQILSGQLEHDEDPFPDAPHTQRLLVSPTPQTPSQKPKMENITTHILKNTKPITIDSDSESEAGPATDRPRSDSIEFIDSTSTKPLREPTPPPVEEDEFAEYVRKAEEERARQRALQSNENAELKKETVKITITSMIPNSSILQVKYLFTKPLRVARDAWVKHQAKKGLSLVADEVVLTWRRKKIYNTSTLIGLGIRPAGSGRIEADDQGSDGFQNNRTVVAIEAWTLDQFQEMEHSEELQRRRDAGELPEEEEIQAQDRHYFMIVLKGRDVDPLDCKVMPETTVDTLIAVFRKQRQISSEKEVSLWWDGERLEEHIEMEEAEIEDHDTIEVHVQ